MIFRLSLEKRQSGTWELWVGRMLHLHVCLAGFGMKDMGLFLSSVPAELPCWGYSPRVALGSIGLEAAGEQEPSSPHPPGNTKRSGACLLSPQLSDVCVALSWLGNVIYGFKKVDHLSSETKLLFLQAARQINIFSINWPPSVLQC